MKTPEQIANLNMLIDHYKALPGVTNWGYGVCVMGALHNMGLIRGRLDDDRASDLIGVDQSMMEYLVAGPRVRVYATMNPVEFRDRVVEVLEGVRDEKSVGWDGLEI